MAAAGFPFQAADQAVVLRTQLDAGHIFHADDATVRCFAHDDVAELLRCCQTSLRQHGVGVLLVRGSRFASDLTSRVDRVLCLDRLNNVRYSDAQLRQLIGLDP